MKTKREDRRWVDERVKYIEIGKKEKRGIHKMDRRESRKGECLVNIRWIFMDSFILWKK